MLRERSQVKTYWKYHFVGEHVETRFCLIFQKMLARTDELLYELLAFEKIGNTISKKNIVQKPLKARLIINFL